MADNKAEQLIKLKLMVDNNNARISNLNNLINKMQRAQDSLARFRRSVAVTRDNMHNLTQNQNQYLSPVKALSSENRSAKNYGEGMSNTLSGIGSKVVGAALVGFLMKIDIKLAAYRTAVSNASNEINQLRSQSDEHNSAIRDLERQISDEENAK